jgi:eukaryotic-like serine/threonine-protein kinase
MIGRLIDGRYQVRSRIARGGMATVYLATDLRLERRVAIKVMHGHLSDDTKFRERFIQEARSAARLAHPNVVNVFDQGQDSDMAYLVMEYLPGITLRDLLQEHGKLTTEQTLDILEAVLAGLSAAHKAGIVHRDLKPENVLLADDGRIKIGDFGLARAASANTATGAALLGTIAYLSPELVTRGVADARSDIYAVGIMTYEMVTGEQPFKGEQPMQIAYQHANDSVPTPSTLNPRVPHEIDELVLWATAREPDERPRDARVMLDEVIAVRRELDAASTQAVTATQRTMVMPTAVAPPRGSTSETQVLAPTARRATPTVSPAVDELAAKSRKRRARGWWLFALVLVVAAVVSGTAWYFGAGPGALVTISDVRADSVNNATAALKADGLNVAKATQHAYDPTVPVGAVMGTVPAIGTPVAKSGTVTLVRSDGPRPYPLPDVRGSAEDPARSRLSHFSVAGQSIEQFDAKSKIGDVLDYLDANGKSLVGHQTYGDQQKITLVVSAGALPAVAGMPVQAAETLLSNAGLTAQPGAQTYSDTVPKDKVIGVDPEPDSKGNPRVFRKGDTDVELIISKGPQLVEVPNVVGETWLQAKAALIKAGFKNLAYSGLADLAPNAVTVESVNPGYPNKVAKTTKLVIKFNGF